MTITAPNRERQLTYAMRWLLFGIVVLVVISVSFYNKTVTLRRFVAAQEKAVDTLKLQNAQLKNSFYSVLDTKTLVAAGERLGYVRDNNPSYLTFRADGTAVENGPSVSLRQ
jgi:hypothetical protein